MLKHLLLSTLIILAIAEAAKHQRKPKELTSSSSGSAQAQNNLFAGTGGFRPPYYYPQQPYYGARPPYNPYPTWGQPPIGGCASSAPCASACLGQQWQRPWYGGSFYPNSYYPYYQNQNLVQPPANPPNEAEEVIDVGKRNYAEFQQPECQFNQCSAGYYNSPCGVRPAYSYGQGSLCGATGGWPNSYCGGGVYMGSYCDEFQCSSDCTMLGYNGGYCEDRCYCWRQVPTQPVVDELDSGVSPESGESS